MPSRPPQKIRGIAETSTSISVEWDEVSPGFVHGNLLGYNLTVRETKNFSKLALQKNLPPNHRSYYVSNLKKYTEYTIWIRAINSKGHGAVNNPGYRTRTGEDGKFSRIIRLY